MADIGALMSGVLHMMRLIWSLLGVLLTPKVLLSPVGTLWTLDRLEKFQFV